uniref:Uncharacterized protein n=1 Tax=Ditylenchus dipsaci TaxID=166011 RepID=A0A915E3R8_9BILA
MRDWKEIKCCGDESDFKLWCKQNTEWWSSWRICNHGKVEEKKLDSPVKEKLKEYEEQEGPKKSPSKDLNRRKTELPTTTQIKNFFYYQNKKEGLVNQLKLSDLRKHAQAYSAVPEDPEKLFVVHFEVSEDKKHWLLVWSTKRLRDVQKAHGPLMFIPTLPARKLMHAFVTPFSLTYSPGIPAHSPVLAIQTPGIPIHSPRMPTQSLRLLTYSPGIPTHSKNSLRKK